MLVAAGLFSVMGAMVKFAIQQYGVQRDRAVPLADRRHRPVCLRALAARDAGDAGGHDAPGARRGRHRGARRSGSTPPAQAAARHGDDAELHLAAVPRRLHRRLRAARPDCARTGGWSRRSCVGFVGVVLLLQPDVHPTIRQVAAAAGLVSGVLSAIAYWYVRNSAGSANPSGARFSTSALSGTVLGFVGTALTGFSKHDARGIALLAGIGITATLAQLAMTRAYAYGHTLVVANLQFVRGRGGFADRHLRSSATTSR